jgi:hypothetical protein
MAIMGDRSRPDQKRSYTLKYMRRVLINGKKLNKKKFGISKGEPQNRNQDRKGNPSKSGNLTSTNQGRKGQK